MDISVVLDPTPPTRSPDTGGLTGNEARLRLARFGPNAMPDTTLHPWRRALRAF